jgi:plasmid replication initiation protein
VIEGKTDLVVKSNRMIEARYRLDLVEQQIILYAICKSRDEQQGLSPNSSVTISAREFAHKFHSDENSVYKQLKDALATLYNRSISLIETDAATGKSEIIETRWISDKSYIDGAGRVKLTFAPKVIPFITRLGENGEFTSYKLEKIGGMSSRHAIRLYEILTQYLTVGRRDLPIDWIKETLVIEGQYEAIKDFKKYVIDLAVAQINEHSDITVSYEQRKTGRVITNFIFTIKHKTKALKKPKTTKITKPVINKAYVDKHARPGETYEAAYQRLIQEFDRQQSLI